MAIHGSAQFFYGRYECILYTRNGQIRSLGLWKHLRFKRRKLVFRLRDEGQNIYRLRNIIEAAKWDDEQAREFEVLLEQARRESYERAARHWAELV